MKPRIRMFFMILSGLGLAGLLLLGVGLALAQGSFRKSPPNPNFSVSREWKAEAVETSSGFWPRRLLDGQTEIWLYNTTTMTFTRITTASAADRDSFFPNLSADGSKLAFSSDSDFLGQGVPLRQLEIWLYDTASMTLSRVTTASDGSRDSLSPNLSADGRKVAFYSDADFLGQGILPFQFEVWLHDSTTMTLTRVTTASTPDRGSFSPTLNADGSKLGFHSDSDLLGQGIEELEAEIWLYDTATMTLTRVTTAPMGDLPQSNSPSLNENGSRIAFHSTADLLRQGIPPFQSEIWLYDTATMTLTRITTASAPDRGSFSPSLSANGTRIAFSSDSDFLNQGINDAQVEIWLYDTTTMTFTRITTASDDERDSSEPSLSADGTKVVFQSDSDFLGQGIPNDQIEIWLYDVTTKSLTRITTASAPNRDSRAPSLNADGTMVAFTSDSDFLGQVTAIFLPTIFKN